MQNWLLSQTLAASRRTNKTNIICSPLSLVGQRMWPMEPTIWINGKSNGRIEMVMSICSVRKRPASTTGKWLFGWRTVRQLEWGQWWVKKIVERMCMLAIAFSVCMSMAMAEHEYFKCGMHGHDRTSQHPNKFIIRICKPNGIILVYIVPLHESDFGLWILGWTQKPPPNTWYTKFAQCGWHRMCVLYAIFRFSYVYIFFSLVNKYDKTKRENIFKIQFPDVWSIWFWSNVYNIHADKLEKAYLFIWCSIVCVWNVMHLEDEYIHFLTTYIIISKSPFGHNDTAEWF